MKRVISISEMAEYCQVTTETIRRWIDSGAIPSSRTLGGHRRIEFRDFVKFLEDNKLPLHDSLIGKKKPVLLVGFNEAERNALTTELVAADKSIFVEHADEAFEAGNKIAQLSPQMVIFKGKAEGFNMLKTAQHLKAQKTTKLIKLAVVLEGGQALDPAAGKLGMVGLTSTDRKTITDLVEA